MENAWLYEQLMNKRAEEPEPVSAGYQTMKKDQEHVVMLS